MYKISLITGDGIGPEIAESVNSILETIHDNLDIKFDIKMVEAGDSALKNTGNALPDDVFQKIKNSDVCLKAPVGEILAVTLFVNGKLTLKYSSRKKEPRGFFCLMGSCQECLVLVNDRIAPACQEIVKEGIIVKTETINDK